MSDSSTSAPTADGSAHAAAPWIGVHVLSEFVFCPRAGVLTFEMGVEDTGEERDHVPPLDYLPDFELELIEERLQHAWQQVARLTAAAVAVGLVLWGAAVAIDPVFYLVLLASGGWFLKAVIEQGKAIVTHARLREAALHAHPQVPDPESDQLQAVNWWSLLKAGFTPIEYAGAHRDTEWRLAGRPWRVLELGSLRIPVFRKVWGEPELYPQHFVRMAAYCRVIEQSEGGRSPYGIILFGHGYDGCTVPHSEPHRQTLREELDKAGQLLAAVQQHNQRPDTPRSLTVCKGCPLGKPRVHIPGKTEIKINGHVRPAHTTKGTDRKPYHSPCGDRFDWVPPHELAVTKGIR